MTAEITTRWSLHLDGGRRTMTWRTGGRVQRLLGHFIDQKGEQEMGVEPSSGQALVLGGQAIQMKQAFEALEGQLDLPVQAI